MKTIHTICRKVAKITDADLAEADQMAADQVGFCHPLKLQKSFRTQEAGKHNQRVLAKVRELRDTILSGD